MGRRSVCGTGPASSTGSPMTLMMRPSVPSPTGTAIAWPVSITSWPRTSPSEESMATVRTVDSPRCWATSSTRRLPWFLVSSAFRIAGKSSPNWTSTTAPMTCVMRPTLLAISSSSIAKLQRLGPGDDLDQLLGDHRLPGAVVHQGLPADHLARVARGVVHGAHLRAVEGGGILDQRAEDLHRHVARQKLGEDILLLRLVLVGCAITLRPCRHERRDDLLGGRNLGHDRLEAREEQRADVEGALLVVRDHLLRDGLGVLELQGAHAAQVDCLDDLLFVLAAELLEPLAADAQELDLLALAAEHIGALAGKPHDRRVERAAQPALAGAHEQEVHLLAAGSGQEPGSRRHVRHRRRDVAEHALHALGIGARGLGGRLRASELGGRHHLHGLGDLLRRLGGGG